MRCNRRRRLMVQGRVAHVMMHVVFDVGYETKNKEASLPPPRPRNVLTEMRYGKYFFDTGQSAGT